MGKFVIGLTNAVPAKNAYITDGISKTLKIGDRRRTARKLRTVKLQHACQKIAQWIDRPGDRVIRALSWLGKDAARDPNAIDTLRSNTPDLVKADLMKGVDNLPVWMRSLAKPAPSAIVRNVCDERLVSA